MTKVHTCSVPQHQVRSSDKRVCAPSDVCWDAPFAYSLDGYCEVRARLFQCTLFVFASSFSSFFLKVLWPCLVCVFFSFFGGESCGSHSSRFFGGGWVVPGDAEKHSFAGTRLEDFCFAVAHSFSVSGPGWSPPTHLTQLGRPFWYPRFFLDVAMGQKPSMYFR